MKFRLNLGFPFTVLQSVLQCNKFVSDLTMAKARRAKNAAERSGWIGRAGTANDTYSKPGARERLS